jgi:hypothetical protein
MPEQVRVRRNSGEPDVVGITVSEGPLTYRLIVTDPYQHQARIVEIPHEEIECVVEAFDGAKE